MELTKEQTSRYGRHLILPEVGVEGQKKLLEAKVLCIGAGGLGSPLALYLAAAGIGKLGIADFDVVDFSNLQRQIIHGESTLGELKAESAKKRIADLNSDVEVAIHNARLTSDNAMEIIREYDVVVDGTDNFPTRYLVNDACVLLGKPNVYGSIFRFEGQVSVFDAKRGPCYRCLYPEPPPPGLVPSCAEGGVLGILPGIVGAMQAAETVKIVLQTGSPLIGKLLFVDVLEMKPRELKLRKDKSCPICGDSPTITGLIDYEQFCGIPVGHESAEQNAVGPNEISVEDFRKMWNGENSPLLLDVRETNEHEICRIEGATLIPLGQIPEKIGELNPDIEIVVHCHHGGRSLKAAEYMLENGFSKVKSLKGGIDKWAEKFDPSMPRY